MNGGVVEPEHGMGFIEAFWLLTACRVRHMRVHYSAVRTPGVKGCIIPESPGNIPLSRQIDMISQYQAKQLENSVNINLSGQKGLLSQYQAKSSENPANINLSGQKGLLING